MFEYELPDDFLKSTDFKLKSYDAWFDDISIKAMKFNFTNGTGFVDTPIFGLRDDSLTNLTYKRVVAPTNVTDIKTTFLNSSSSLNELDNDFYAMINFAING